MKSSTSHRAITALITLVSLPLAMVATPLCAAFAAPAETSTTTRPPYEKSIEAFEARDKEAPPPADAALFIGSSSIRRWATLAHDFPEIPTTNRGFSGSKILDSVRYIPRIVLPYHPRITVMFAGDDDIGAGKSPAQVLKAFHSFVTTVRTSLPTIPIAYISINPTIKGWKHHDKTIEVNRLIANYARTVPNLTFIDSYSHLLGADGLPQKSLLAEDGLHLNPDGYKAWTAIIKPPILHLYATTKPRTTP